MPRKRVPAKKKSSSVNTRNWLGAIFRDPVPDAMDLARRVAGVGSAVEGSRVADTADRR